MTRQLRYEFEELPLLIDNGFSAGLVNGSALLNYWADGQWGIAEIYLDGHRKRPTVDIVKAIREERPGPICYEDKPVQLERGSWLHSAIWSRLEDDWREHVQDAVREAIEIDREEAAEFRAEQRRERL